MGILQRVTPQEITSVNDMNSLVNYHGGSRELYYLQMVIDGQAVFSFGSNEFRCPVDDVQDNAAILAAMLNTAISNLVATRHAQHVMSPYSID